jgi:metal-sulfur cluster biosynthetic enzyme
MTLTSPACPVAEALLDQVQYVVQQVDEIDEAKVNLVFDPPWDMNKLTPEGKEIMILNGAAI